LAEFMAAANVRGLPLKSAICTAEQLPDFWKKRMEESFQVPVYSYYGCGEVNSLGYQQPGYEGYIVPQEHVVIEPSTEDSSVFREEGFGPCCVTALYNYAMPILRYLNGDLLETGYVNQGLPHQRIIRLEGRVMDYLQASDGHQVSGALGAHMILKCGLPVWKWQLVQVGSNCIEFHYAVRGESDLSPEAQSVAVQVLKKHLGQDMEIRWILEQFETPASGKHRLIINKVAGSGQKAVAV
jgi:phenylacetate-CoA ligase